MHILSIGKTISNTQLNIHSIKESELIHELHISSYDYIIISGGDGTLRRVLKQIHTSANLPAIILNPTGSFNVIAKLHHVPTLNTVLTHLENKQTLPTQKQNIYGINEEIFLFSAGNMGDLQHIFLAETLRFGFLEKGISKYILTLLFLLPVHIIMTPFMLMSPRRFFIFTPLKCIRKFGSFYGKVEEMSIDLKNDYNYLELDGDIVSMHESKLSIKHLNTVRIVVKPIPKRIRT